MPELTISKKSTKKKSTITLAKSYILAKNNNQNYILVQSATHSIQITVHHDVSQVLSASAEDYNYSSFSTCLGKARMSACLQYMSQLCISFKLVC